MPFSALFSSICHLFCSVKNQLIGRHLSSLRRKKNRQLNWAKMGIFDMKNDERKRMLLWKSLKITESDSALIWPIFFLYYSSCQKQIFILSNRKIETNRIENCLRDSSVYHSDITYRRWLKISQLMISFDIFFSRISKVNRNVNSIRYNFKPIYPPFRWHRLKFTLICRFKEKKNKFNECTVFNKQWLK